MNFEQALMIFLMTAVIILSIAAGIYNTTYSKVDNGVLEDLVESKPVLVAPLQYSKGLLSVTTLPTTEFVHLKAATIVYSKTGTLIAISSPVLNPLLTYATQLE